MSLTKIHAPLKPYQLFEDLARFADLQIMYKSPADDGTLSGVRWQFDVSDYLTLTGA